MWMFIANFWKQKGVGILSTRRGLIGAVAVREGAGFRVQEVFDEGVSEVKPLYILERESQAPVVSAIDTSETLVRSLSLPLKKRSDIDAVLPFEAEPLLPFPIDEAIVEGIVRSQTHSSSELTLMAVRKEAIAAHLAPLQSRGIEPDRISAVPYALAQFAKQIPPEHPARFVVYLSDEGSSCLLLTGQTLAAAYSIPESLDNRSRFLLSLSQTLYALRKTAKMEGEADLLFCGPALPDPSTLANWAAELPYPMSLFSSNSLSGDVDFAHYALPIGLAIQAAQEGEAPDFRKGAYRHPQPWKKSLRSLLMTGALSLAFALSLSLFGRALVRQQKNQVQQEYLNLLGDLQYSHETFEREFFPLLDEPIPALETMTAEQYAERLAKVEKEIQKNPHLFPLYPQVPRVSDLFAWFVNHPKVVKVDAETGEKTPLLHFENFTYSMVKRPDIAKPKEKYQVKVELEFSTETPKYAREFHDALIAPNEIVDPKSEVKWSSQRGKYRASFFLKDKTTYHLAKEGA